MVVWLHVWTWPAKEGFINHLSTIYCLAIDLSTTFSDVDFLRPDGSKRKRSSAQISRYLFADVSAIVSLSWCESSAMNKRSHDVYTSWWYWQIWMDLTTSESSNCLSVSVLRWFFKIVAYANSVCFWFMLQGYSFQLFSQIHFFLIFCSTIHIFRLLTDYQMFGLCIVL